MNRLGLERNNVKLRLTDWFWLFWLGGFLGCLYEDVVYSFRVGHIAFKQGLIYEPLILIYGLSAIIFVYIFNHLKSKYKIVIFFMIAIVGGILEFIFSYIQEKLCGTVSWDYSYQWFDISGRTSLFNALLIGVGGYIYVIYIYPWFINILKKYTARNYNIVTVLVFCLFVTDVFITSVATYRSHERREGVEAVSDWQKIFDKYYPDERIKYVGVSARSVDK